MEDAYIGSIMLWSHSKIPQGWVLCDGRKMIKSQNEALFAVLGNVYGGDGIKDFALPDLRGRTVVGRATTAESNNWKLGLLEGAEAVQLTAGQLPAHIHMLMGMNSTSNPVARVDTDVCLGSGDVAQPMNLYTTNMQGLTTLAPDSITSTGGGVKHNNMQPFLVLNYIICIQGYFPPRQ